MSAANKAKGTKWERDIVEYLTPVFETTRLPRTGAKDEGDAEVRLRDNLRLVLEAKAVKSINLADFVDQALTESGHREDRTGVPTYGAAIVKRRNKGTGDGYVVFSLEEFREFLVAVLHGRS